MGVKLRFNNVNYWSFADPSASKINNTKIILLQLGQDIKQH